MVWLSILSPFLSLSLSYAQWELQENYGNKVGDSVALTGQGSVYLAASDSYNGEVDIYLSYQRNTTTTFGQVAKLTSSTPSAGFGKVVDFADHGSDGSTSLLVAEVDEEGAGRTYIYSGTWNQWTNTQILTPPSKFRRFSQFSTYLEVDRSSSLVAIGCPYCNLTKYAGQIYLYEKAPSTATWSNSQILNAQYYDYLVAPSSISFFLGGLLSIDGNVLASSTLTYRSGNDFVWGVVLFTQSSTGQWSQQQTLTSSSYDLQAGVLSYQNIDVFAVNDETIAFSTVSQPYQNTENVGSVTILYPNTKRFIAPYSPSKSVLTEVTNHLVKDEMESKSIHHHISQINRDTPPEDLIESLSSNSYVSPKKKSFRKAQFRMKKRPTNPIDQHTHMEYQRHASGLYSRQLEEASELNDLDIPLKSDFHTSLESARSFSQTTSTGPSFSLVPRPLSWSTRQILYPPGRITESSNFGSDLSLSKNTLIIGEQGTSHIYYYSRPKSSTVMGLWSFQQILSPAKDNVLFYSDNYILNSYLITLGLIALDDTNELNSITMDFYLNNKEWDCLLITLEDVFGDGWNDMFLTLTTPSQKKYYYTMKLTSFETPNPFKIRYCPDESEEEFSENFQKSYPNMEMSGYTIQIERNNTVLNVGSFFWEIQYRTQIESHDNRHTDVLYGNYATKHQFSFDWLTHSFQIIKSYRSLPNPVFVVCESCRVYKASDITSYEALVDDLSQWRYLNLYSNNPSIPWYNEDDPYHSTYYYLSDMYGSKLIYSGTMCPQDLVYDSPNDPVMHSCWLDIPSDGTYLLRITGALYLDPSSPVDNLSKNSHSWNFCYKSGYVNSHVYFTVSNNGKDCFVNAIYPIDIYRQDNLLVFIQIRGQFNVIRIAQATPNEQNQVTLNAYDRAQFSSAISSVLWEISPRDISVSQYVLIPSNVHENLIDFTLRLNVQKRENSDAKDYYSMKSIASDIIQEIEEGVTNGNILRGLKSTNVVPESRYFETSTKVVISSKLYMEESITIVPSLPTEEFQF